MLVHEAIEYSEERALFGPERHW